MIKVDIKSELPSAIAFTNEHVKQLPHSVGQALNSVVAGSNFVPGSKRSSIVAALEKASKTSFDRPTSYTTKAWRLGNRANKYKPVAQLVPKDLAKTGNREPHLRHSIIGGQRGMKPFEAKLATHPLAKLPPGSRLVPVSVKRNRAGNVTQKTLEGIYNNVGKSVFIGTPRGGNRPPGVYRREEYLMKGTSTVADPVLRPLFYAVPSATYRPRLRVEQVAKQTTQKEFGNQLRFWLAKNVRDSTLMGRADRRVGFL